VEVSARVVVLCAQSLESTRILLNSATRQHPTGLGNPSGVLGHYLMDHHASAGASGALPPPVSTPQSVGGAQRPSGVYVIRFRNTLNGPQQKDFIRGYGFQGGGGTRMNWRAPGFGEAYKAAIRRPVGYLNLGRFRLCCGCYQTR
jgi:choline dehydrogenase-like flavoprotein